MYTPRPAIPRRPATPFTPRRRSIPPATAVKFASYERYKEALQQAWAPAPVSGVRRSRPTSPLWLKLGAGSLSGLTATACTYPLEVAHTRLAADLARRGQHVHHRGVLACVAAVAREEGVLSLCVAPPFPATRARSRIGAPALCRRGYAPPRGSRRYRGMGVAAARTVPFFGVSFALYDALKPATRAHRGETWPGAIASRTLRGAVATLAAQALVFPLDTIKRRLQFDRAPASPSTHLPQYRGAAHCAQQMLRHEGWRSFYRGLPANALRTVPGAALQFVVYEYVKSVMTNEEFVG